MFTRSKGNPMETIWSEMALVGVLLLVGLLSGNMPHGRGETGPGREPGRGRKRIAAPLLSAGDSDLG
jgi:hypothetical protein